MTNHIFSKSCSSTTNVACVYVCVVPLPGWYLMVLSVLHIQSYTHRVPSQKGKHLPSQKGTVCLLERGSVCLPRRENTCLFRGASAFHTRGLLQVAMGQTALAILMPSPAAALQRASCQSQVHQPSCWCMASEPLGSSGEARSKPSLPPATR